MYISYYAFYQQKHTANLWNPANEGVQWTTSLGFNAMCQYKCIAHNVWLYENLLYIASLSVICKGSKE